MKCKAHRAFGGETDQKDDQEKRFQTVQGKLS